MTAAAVAPLGNVEVMPIGYVKPYPGNPRKIPKKAIEQTALSIREFGWQQPLVVDGGMVIIAGHARYLAARHLGLAEVPVIVAENLTPAQARAFRVVDNRTHDYSAWDYHGLIEELNGLGDEFAPVLDLADWDKLIRAWEDGGGAEKRKLPLGDATDEDVAVALSGGYAVHVVFASRAAADKAGPALAAVAGVIDVRHPH